MTGNLAVPPKFSNVTALDLQITAADRSNLFRWTPGRDGLLYRRMFARTPANSLEFSAINTFSLSFLFSIEYRKSSGMSINSLISCWYAVRVDE